MGVRVLVCLYVFKKGKTAEPKFYGWFKNNTSKVLTFFEFSQRKTRKSTKLKVAVKTIFQKYDY